MKLLRALLRRSRGERAGPAPDLFDVFHARTMTSISDSRGQPFGAWSALDAESSARAPRFVLGVLRERPRVRRRFPDATSADGGYREWLMSGAIVELSPDARRNIAATFEADLAASVREFYLHNPEVQWRYPLGLLPVGQKRFVKWLLGKGRSQHELTDEQLLWFLHATAEDLPRHIALTYLINPEWQERFPPGALARGELQKWLRREYPRYKPLRTVRDLPPLSPAALRKSVAATPSMALGVNFLAHFCYPSGLKQAALGYVESLEAAGFQVACRDVPAGIRTALSPRQPWLGLEQFPISLTNVSPVPHFTARYRRAGLAPRAGVLHIAYWAWELEEVPPEWAELADSIHEVWAPTAFVAEAMRKRMPVPVYTMLPGVDIGEVETIPRARLGIPDNDCVFLFMFDMSSDFERKNPLALVRAFRDSFAVNEAATLVVKLCRGTLDAANLQRLRDAAASAKIVVIDEVVSRAQAYGYIALADCVVSLHRSEGFGLLMAEAMLLGKPVIATGYSGNTDFLNAENSLPIDYTLTEIIDDGPIYKAGNRWADPSVEHASRRMRWVFENRADAATLGRRGQADAQQLFAPATAGERMKVRIAQVWEQHQRS